MNKLVPLTGAVLATGLTVLGLVMAPSAMATDETGPTSVACAQSNAAVAAAAIKANAKADEIAAGQDVVIKDLKEKADAAQAVYDAAYATYQAAPNAVNLDALQDAQAALDKALAALSDAPGVPATQKSELAALQAALKVAIDKSVKACDVVVPTPTVTPTATPPLFADCAAVRAAGLAPLGRDERGYRLALDSDGDGQACEAIEGQLPTRIDTGYAA